MDSISSKIKCRKFEYECAREIMIGEDCFYTGDDLGVNYTPEETMFKVWAPGASRLRLSLYLHENDKKPVFTRDFKKTEKGTWTITLKGNYEGIYFIYEVKRDNSWEKVVDPYTRALSTNSRYGLIVDLDKCSPPGWEDDRQIFLEKPQDAVIYEVHVRDFSTSPDSGIKQKGKFLGFTESGTVSSAGFKTGIDHLLELGITHVQLQPVFDFATVDERSDGEYNWGYDPYFYNAPEGSYASDPSNDSRIREFKQMVKALHDKGLGVIMDVVYNHTFMTEDSPFNKLVPGYYYRFDGEGNYANGSGVGNEIASERPMVRKFIIDSVKYWAEEYHIDGFRFDLMALHDKETMAEIASVLRAISPSILIYGEPWMGCPSPLDHSKQMLKGAQQGMKIAVFNDNFRNAVKGDNDGCEPGFVSGAPFQVDNIKKGAAGSIYYNDEIKDFAAEPEESINYVSSHDNLSLWDKLKKSNFRDSEAIRIRMDHLSQAVIFTSQGIAFMQGGEELLRTKWGDHNSYKSGDEINQIKWERKKHYYQTFKYYQGLIVLRREHPAFRMNSAHEIRSHLEFIKTPSNTVGLLLKDHAGGDEWENILVFYNPNRNGYRFKAPFCGEWKVVVNDKESGNDILDVCTGEYGILVPPISAMVLFQ